MQTTAKIASAGLNGVSCPTATSCVADGIRGGLFGSLTAGVSETWNGTTWTAVTIPPSAEQSALYGVSCSSATLCYAVGDSSTKGGSENTMTDKWNGAEWKLVSLPVPSGTTNSMWARGVLRNRRVLHCYRALHKQRAGGIPDARRLKLGDRPQDACVVPDRQRAPHTPSARYLAVADPRAGRCGSLVRQALRMASADRLADGRHRSTHRPWPSKPGRCRRVWRFTCGR